MDALVVKPVSLMDAENEDATESHILDERDTCCLAKIRLVGEPLGISCQQLFEHAYLRAGHTVVFARAVFAMYLEFKGLGPIPTPVESYLKQLQEKDHEAIGGKNGFCAGCMLDRAGIVGFVSAYELICPVSVAEANTNGTGKLSKADEYYIDLLDSGALIEENETWQDVVNGGFEDLDTFE